MKRQEEYQLQRILSMACIVLGVPQSQLGGTPVPTEVTSIWGAPRKDMGPENGVPQKGHDTRDCSIPHGRDLEPETGVPPHSRKRRQRLKMDLGPDTQVLPPCGRTHTCENIIFPILRMRWVRSFGLVASYSEVRIFDLTV